MSNHTYTDAGWLRQLYDEYLYYVDLTVLKARGYDCIPLYKDAPRRVTYKSFSAYVNEFGKTTGTLHLQGENFRYRLIYNPQSHLPNDVSFSSYDHRTGEGQIYMISAMPTGILLRLMKLVDELERLTSTTT
jgi:hypothetical protein